MSANGGLDWLATFSPTANDASRHSPRPSASTSTRSPISAATPAASASIELQATVPIDTLVAHRHHIVLDHTTLTGVQTAGVTITFSEAVSGFTNADLTVAGRIRSRRSPAATAARTGPAPSRPAPTSSTTATTSRSPTPASPIWRATPASGTTTSSAYNVRARPGRPRRHRRRPRPRRHRRRPRRWGRKRSPPRRATAP